MENLAVEKQLNDELSGVERAVMEISIESQEDYDKAGALAREIKRVQGRVKEYWEPMRIAAKNAYDSVLNHKREMSDPLERAEKYLKGKMSDYMAEVERKRREKEEEIRRLAVEEAKRKLEEAAKAEENGDSLSAEMALAEAEVMETASSGLSIQKEDMKTDGVATVKTWEIVSIDSGIVPDYVAGVEIRPVDEKAVLRLIKSSKGTVQIPGVVYKESVEIRVRK